jgi:hypothetical protein
MESWTLDVRLTTVIYIIYCLMILRSVNKFHRHFKYFHKIC